MKQYHKPALTDMSEHEMLHTDGGGFIAFVAVLIAGIAVVAGYSVAAGAVVVAAATGAAGVHLVQTAVGLYNVAMVDGR